MWRGGKDFCRMHVTQRPVVVAMVSKLLDGAGRVGRMAISGARAGRVQQADIEPSFGRRRIRQSQVLGNTALGKAATVDYSFQIFEMEGARLRAGEDVNVARHLEPRGKAIFGIVVAEDHDDADPRALEASHPIGEEQSRLI